MKQNRGLIKLILVIIVAIFLINYFHIDVRVLWEQIIRVGRLIWAFVMQTWHSLTPAK